MTVVVPPHAEAEAGFGAWLATVRQLSHRTTGTLRVLGPEETLPTIRCLLREGQPSVAVVVEPWSAWEDFPSLSRQVSSQDLLVVVSARDNAVSYQAAAHRIPDYLSHHFGSVSFVVLYPEQVLAYEHRLV